MKNSSSKNAIIAIVIILVLFIGGYFYLKGTPNDDAVSSLDIVGGQGEADANASIKGSQILLLLSQIKSINIDTSIFNNQMYKSLIDYTVEVPQQNVGKVNPFAEFIGSNVSVSTNTETKTTTTSKKTSSKTTR